MASCLGCDCWKIGAETMWVYIFAWYRKNLSTLWPNPQVLLCCCLVSHVLLLGDPIDHSPPGFSVHGIFPGKNAGEGCHFLLQGIFLIQGLSLHLLSLLHWQVDSLPPSHQWSPYFDTNKTQNPWHPPCHLALLPSKALKRPTGVFTCSCFLFFVFVFFNLQT